MKKRLYLLLFGFFLAFSTAQAQDNNAPYPDARPWTRLWWFADTTTNAMIMRNLDYLKEKGFGGVECAFIYPYKRKDTLYAPRHEWLSPAFIEKVRFAKAYALRLGMGCDLTLGTLWPFGDEHVRRDESTVCLKDSTHTDSMRLIWSHPTPGLVMDHLNRETVRNYCTRLANAFDPVLREGGRRSQVFVDSWELSSRFLSSKGFEKDFLSRCGYPIGLYVDSLYKKTAPLNQMLYDYRKMVSEYTIEHFYKEFTRVAHEHGALSRGQAAGAPCDIISAYAALDVPESEALLYEPRYANIPAAAAAYSGKNTVTSETFTCLYGWPAYYFKKEQTADLKLLADALFANGVNHVFWHGKPLTRTERDTFYATVHLGESGVLNAELKDFNAYMTKICTALKQGHPCSKVAVYLPLEDAWIKGELPIEQQKIWSWGYYEMREDRLPEELRPWHPMWINGEFLRAGVLEGKVFRVGPMRFEALYVDAEYLDGEVLTAIVALAEKGFPIVLKRTPKQPGFLCSELGSYDALAYRMSQLPNVSRDWSAFAGRIAPLVSGRDLPEYWCRETEAGLTFFFAHPKTKDITYPMNYGQSFNRKKRRQAVVFYDNGREIPFQLEFKPYQSVLLRVKKDGQVQVEDITFVPKKPKRLQRPRKAYERWEVDPAKYDPSCH